LKLVRSSSTCCWQFNGLLLWWARRWCTTVIGFTNTGADWLVVSITIICSKSAKPKYMDIFTDFKMCTMWVYVSWSLFMNLNFSFCICLKSTHCLLRDLIHLHPYFLNRQNHSCRQKGAINTKWYTCTIRKKNSLIRRKKTLLSF